MGHEVYGIYAIRRRRILQACFDEASSCWSFSNLTALVATLPNKYDEAQLSREKNAMFMLYADKQTCLMKSIRRSFQYIVYLLFGHVFNICTMPISPFFYMKRRVWRNSANFCVCCASGPGRLCTSVDFVAPQWAARLLGGLRRRTHWNASETGRHLSNIHKNKYYIIMTT